MLALDKMLLHIPSAQNIRLYTYPSDKMPAVPSSRSGLLAIGRLPWQDASHARRD